MPKCTWVKGLRAGLTLVIMDKLTSPKFKSKVEQFYYENGASSELDLTAAVDEVLVTVALSRTSFHDLHPIFSGSFTAGRSRRVT